ncbi:MAG: prolyl oligopeptidase family serine peptidase [Flavobacterium nitrogenifigens]|nr:prolyl oligopeptidase family serine peptidase [Flavobacterium nitrogenifigens]
MQAINLPYDRFFIRAACFIFVLVTCPSIWGQAKQKRMLSTEEYHLWSQILPEKISSDGNWVSYSLKYEYSGADTLIVRQTKGNTKYVFPKGWEGKFNEESEFACIANDTLVVQNLKTDKNYKRPDAFSFEFSANNKFIAIFLKQKENKFSLEIRDQKGILVEQTADITSYCFDPLKNGVVYSTAKDNLYGIEMIFFKNSVEKKIVASDHKAPFQNVIWKGNAIAFIENDAEEPVLYSYSITQNKLSVLESKNTRGFPSDMRISNVKNKIPIYSKDGTKLFFWMKEPSVKTKNIDSSAVEIWNSKDKLLYDFKKFLPYYKWADKLAVWDIKENKVLQIADKDLPSAFLSADHKHAFIFDPAAYEPQSQQHGAYDLYIMNLQSGNRELILKHYTFSEKPLGSPDGKYLCYVKDGNWWIYDLDKKRHTCITLGMSNSFFEEDSNVPGEPEPYGIAGWMPSGEIILYDRFDLWKISLDGKVKKRLTKGREIQKTFRVKNFNTDLLYGVSETTPLLVDLKEGLFLTVINKQTRESGFSIWNLKSGVKELVWKKKKISEVNKAGKKNLYMYEDQDFASPPRIMIWDGSAKEIMQSNPQQHQFYWSKNECIDYTVKDIKTKGILFYPADYKAGLKYPMVVRIYERQFSSFNDYANPSMLEGDGFSVTNFTNQGYFVLYPDINYEFGNLRESVTNSVLAAVDAAVEKGNIDPGKIGLIGHSFGAYEVDLIITQTDRFAAAVAGSAWTDLVSAYLYVGPSFYRPDFFRTENHQLRIGKSLYEDMPSYLKNSPVLLADAVKTPLLAWTGKEDRHVNASQTMEFYLALRRADKEHTLLIYPGEEHTIDKKENALDLNLRVMQWFNYYLKNGEKKDWMRSDFNR